MSESEFNALMDRKLAECQIRSAMSVEQIAMLCQMFSTSVCTVSARIEMVDGKVSAFFVREVAADAIPKYLKRVG